MEQPAGEGRTPVSYPHTQKNRPGDIRFEARHWARLVPSRGIRPTGSRENKKPAWKRLLGVQPGSFPLPADACADRTLAVTDRAADGERGAPREFALAAGRQRRLAVAVANAGAAICVLCFQIPRRHYCESRRPRLDHDGYNAGDSRPARISRRPVERGVRRSSFQDRSVLPCFDCSLR